MRFDVLPDPLNKQIAEAAERYGSACTCKPNQMRINAECAERLCSLFTKKQLFALIEVSEELKRRLAKNMNQKLLITWLSAALKKAVEY